MRTNTFRPKSIVLTLFLALTGIVITSLPVKANVARIVSIEGEVELQRDNWSRFYRAFSGADLYGPDLIRPSRGSRVEVLCPNGTTTWIVPAGTISAVNNGCPGTPARLKPQFGIGDLRGGIDPSLPYVITPRTGIVLSPRPLLRWNPVEGAESYTVTLKARGEVVWQIDTDQTELMYPDDQPDLMPRRLYTLNVMADTGASSADEDLALRFNVLTGEQAEEAQVRIDSINALDIADELKTLILVEEIYPNYQLTGAAIHDLEGLIAAGIETAQIYRLLGDVYLKSGLRLLAEESYVKAIALATQSNNLEEQVFAQLGLGTLYLHVGETDRAMRQLHCAQKGASELGDEKLIESIEETLSQL
ncbi:MAG: tetratricopeptide repeat protein [Cyanobacteria bacterium P01_F01_bin.150]